MSSDIALTLKKDLVDSSYAHIEMWSVDYETVMTDECIYTLPKMYSDVAERVMYRMANARIGMYVYTPEIDRAKEAVEKAISDRKDLNTINSLIACLWDFEDAHKQKQEKHNPKPGEE